MSWYDSTSGLCWQNPPDTTTRTYSNSVTFCTGLGPDWRVPNINELRSIIFGCDTMEIDGSCDLADPGCLTWNCAQSSAGCTACTAGSTCRWKPELSGLCDDIFHSSSFDPGVNYNWSVNYLTASFNSYNLSSLNYVRCVRND